ncbi:putative membrane protein [Synechococcus sp. SYN20]|nr:putative membrane protein [Synechococcus sp. SYN20]
MNKTFLSDLTLIETDSLSIAFAVSTSFYWLVVTYFLFDLLDA